MKKLAIITIFIFMSLSLLNILCFDTITAQETFPKVFNIPNGWQPEGIAVGRGTEFFVGSLLTGAIYRGDLRTGEGEILVPPQQGRIAVGLAVDPRSNAIFVAGGGPALGFPIPGSAYVYDADTGTELAVYPLDGQFVNDVVITREAAYFTDSLQPLIYRIPLGSGGELPDPSDPSAIQVIKLGIGFDFNPFAFPNANGIEATPNGKWLIVVNTAFNSVYKVNPLNGEATKIDLGGADLPNGDGLVLAGRTLFIVQNYLNQIGVVTLDQSLSFGILNDEPLTSDAFNIPTTAAKFGKTIYAVNARFSDYTWGFPTPDLEFTVVGLPMR